MKITSVVFLRRGKKGITNSDMEMFYNEIKCLMNRNGYYF